MASVASGGSALRIFGFSLVASLGILLAVLFGLGGGALLITLILAVVEITFSFDNAIINAKVLGKVSAAWQAAFLTLGILVAIFGMRVVFPIVIVMVTASLGWNQVVNLALHHPHEYAHHLEQAHASIAAFGGAFLLMLALTFFLDDEREVHWIAAVERQLSRFSHWLIAPAAAVVLVVGVAVLPANTHGTETLTAGLFGAATYILLQVMNGLFGRLQGSQPSTAKQTGVTALMSLIYLEILDASFSFDGVIGAFAITSNIVLIAAGLGIGALWVRSLTVFMVRRHTLGRYVFIEHGAHYTVLILALVLLASIMWSISDYIPGLIGIGVIGASVVASVRDRQAREQG
ncbi:MAG TPA: DUF475 domain-containing protein [Candidatus Saccharimonadia bacterium]|nr:DUF475 domain-containing protein [Candidatus Saccharimonadia bacterium]